MGKISLRTLSGARVVRQIGRLGHGVGPDWVGLAPVSNRTSLPALPM